MTINLQKVFEKYWKTKQAESELKSRADDMEKEHIIRVLRQTGGNKKKAAEILGIERRTLYNKAKRLGIDFSSV